MLDDKATYLIDTREPYEHGANSLAELFTVAESKVINIPLSRMANAIVQGQLNKAHIVQTEMLKEAFPDYQASLQANEMANYIYNFAISGNRFYNGKVLQVSNTTP